MAEKKQTPEKVIKLPSLGDVLGDTQKAEMYVEMLRNIATNSGNLRLMQLANGLDDGARIPGSAPEDDGEVEIEAWDDDQQKLVTKKLRSFRQQFAIYEKGYQSILDKAEEEELLTGVNKLLDDKRA